jgi:hypothetical protein
MKSEIWKPIKDYEGLYEISSLGRVKSLPKDKKSKHGSIAHLQERLLTPSNNHGYRSIVLTNNGVHKTNNVHRLVAEAFIPNPNNYSDINHKDENKANNSVSNLEWCTRVYNMNYGTCQNRKAISNGKPINQYSIDGVYIRSYLSIKDAATKNNYQSSPILNCCVGRSKSSYGYKWEYKKIENDG